MKLPDPLIPSQKRPVPKRLKEYEASATSRDEAIIDAYASGGFSMKEIGEHFGLHYSRVSRILSKAQGKT
ncbi:MAG: hypothetical protein EXR84_06290 [Gammaproteobacteria bacterium]|nr:hypothetical protein [Gammaproteobacteria bacterium]